jgi:hypothetical protein
LGAVGGIDAEVLCANAGALGANSIRQSARVANGFNARREVDWKTVADASDLEALKQSPAAFEVEILCV